MKKDYKLMACLITLILILILPLYADTEKTKIPIEVSKTNVSNNDSQNITNESNDNLESDNQDKHYDSSESTAKYTSSNIDEKPLENQTITEENKEYTKTNT